MDPLLAGISRNVQQEARFLEAFPWEQAVEAVVEGAARGLAFYQQNPNDSLDVVDLDPWGSTRLSYDPLQQGFELAVEPGLLNPSLNAIPGWETVIEDHPGIENHSQTLVAKLEARQGKRIPVVEKPRQNKAPRWDQVFEKPAFQENRSGQAAVGRGVFEEQASDSGSAFGLAGSAPDSTSRYGAGLQRRLQEQQARNQQHLQHAQQPKSYTQLAQVPQAQPPSLNQRWFPRPANRFQQAVQETLNSRSPEQLTTRALRQSVHELELAAHQPEQAFSLEDFEALKTELVMGLAEKALEKLSKNQAGRYQVGPHDLLEPEALELQLANVREQLEAGKPLEPWQQEQVLQKIRANPNSLSNQVKSLEYYRQHPEQILVDRPEAGNIRALAELTHLSYQITATAKKLDIEPSDALVTRAEFQALLPAGSTFKHQGAFNFPSGISGSIFEAPDHVVVTIDGTNDLKEWVTDGLIVFDHYPEQRALDAQFLIKEAAGKKKPITLVAHSLGRLDAEMGAKFFIKEKYKQGQQVKDPLTLISFDGLRNDRISDDFNLKAQHGMLTVYDLATPTGPVHRIFTGPNVFIVQDPSSNFFTGTKVPKVLKPFLYPKALVHNHSMDHFRNHVMPDINISDLGKGRLTKPGVPLEEKRRWLGIITPVASSTAAVSDGFH
jgi:hypothetical protein